VRIEGVFLSLTLVPAVRRREDALRWTLSFFRPYRARLALLGSLSLAEIALRAVSPWPFKAVVDLLVGHAAVGRPAARLLALVGVGLLVQLGHQLVLMVHTRVQARMAQDVVFTLRSRVFEHLQYLSLSHHANASTADAVYRLDTDAGCLDDLLLRGLFPAMFSGLTLVVMFAILLRLDTGLALLSMAVVPFLYANLRAHMRRMGPHADEAKTLESATLARVYESLSAIRLVKTFAREDHEVGRFQHVAAEATRARLSVTRRESWFGFIVGAITVAGSAAVLALGGLHVLDGRLSVGTLLVIVAYLGFVYGPLSAIATTTGALHTALAGVRRVREILGLARETPDAPDCLGSARLRGEVRFDDVSFGYGPGTRVLDRVTFTAKPGETVALVGLSGAGKSTLVSLIGRLYEPSSGRVLIDGVDARRYGLRSLREQIAVVLQDAVLFDGSIADNVLYGRLDADDHDVVVASRAAHAEEFIATLRRGFDTPVGEKGMQLSGGQRQRLSIARAFLKDAPILILDEPTASLDTLSEQAVLTAMREVRKGRTTFVIAHRLSTVREADRILVLDAGRITAEGRHDQLLRTSDLYRQLCAQLADEPPAPAEANPAAS
jgi:ATP-binding cassette subfamily B protein/subfamily B ATP-binding cassette protein MsbA